MPSIQPAYTDADVQAALQAAYGGTPCQPVSFEICEQDMIDALDAVAPAIAARALREVADRWGKSGAVTPWAIVAPRSRADEIDPSA